MNVKAFTVGIAALAFVSPAEAGDWEPVGLTGNSEPAGATHRTCYYRSVSAYLFSIVVDSVCPISTTVNPKTGSVRQ